MATELPCLNRAPPASSLLSFPDSPLRILPPGSSTRDMPHHAAGTRPAKKPNTNNHGNGLSLAGNLPDYAVTEVLSWLPVTSLLRFASVSSLWRDLIFDPWFADLHSTRGAARQTECLLAARPFDHFARRLWLVHPGCGRPKYRRYEVDGPPQTWDIRFTLRPTCCATGTEWQVPSIASCKGLLCSYEPRRIGVSNPVLNKTLWLPLAPDDTEGLLGFGFDPASGDYKVIVQSRVRDDQDCSKTWMCILSNRRAGGKLGWKELPEGFPRLFEKTKPELGLYFGGSLHWTGNARGRPTGRPLILSFDLKSESYHQWLGPKIDWSAPHGYCCLVLLKDTIGFVIQDLLSKKKGAAVWRLVDRASEEWVKDTHAVGVLKKIHEPYWMENKHGLWVDSKSWKKGRNKMVYYDFSGRRFESARLPLAFRNCPDRYAVHSASLLLPPDPGRCAANKSLNSK